MAKSDVDLARTALDQARAGRFRRRRAQIHQQTASLTQTTRVNIDRTVIRSPVDGVVLTRTIEPGQTVAASLSGAGTVHHRRGPVEDEDRAAGGRIRHRPGQGASRSASTRRCLPDRQFKGVVDQVRLSATTANNVVTYPVIVTVDNSDGTLLPGLTVNAEIEVSKRSKRADHRQRGLRFKPVEGSPLADLQAASRGVVASARRGAAPPAWRGRPGRIFSRQHGTRCRAAGGVDAALEQMRQARPIFGMARPDRIRAAAACSAAARFGGLQRGAAPGCEHAGADAPAHARTLQPAVRRVHRQPGRRPEAPPGTALEAQLAKRVTSTLVDGKPVAVMARVGASDGSNTERIGRGIAEGDLVITGERLRRRAK